MWRSGLGRPIFHRCEQLFLRTDAGARERINEEKGRRNRQAASKHERRAELCSVLTVLAENGPDLGSGGCAVYIFSDSIKFANPCQALVMPIGMKSWIATTTNSPPQIVARCTLCVDHRS